MARQCKASLDTLFSATPLYEKQNNKHALFPNREENAFSWI